MGSSWRRNVPDLGLLGFNFRPDWRLAQCTLAAELITPESGFTHVVRVEVTDVFGTLRYGFLAKYGSTVGVVSSIDPIAFPPARFPYGREVVADAP